jgi:hypothetical protein
MLQDIHYITYTEKEENTWNRNHRAAVAPGMHDENSRMPYRPPIGGHGMQHSFIPLPGRITGLSFTIPSGML